MPAGKLEKTNLQLKLKHVLCSGQNNQQKETIQVYDITANIIVNS